MIPVATATITVIRVVQPEDGFLDPYDHVLAEGVRAVLSEPGGSRSAGYAGTSSDNTRKLTCDPTDLKPGDKVLALQSMYRVEWVSFVAGAFPHLTAGLREVVRG